MSEKIPYEEITDRIKDDVDYIADEAYQKGLDDAWECARKIVCFSEDGGISVDNLFDIFSTSIYSEIFRDFSVSEAMERIKAYEDEHKIRVGDEVKAWYGNAIVTCVDEKAKTAHFFYKTGYSGCDYLKNIERTGRHFDAVETLLEILMESEESK